MHNEFVGAAASACFKAAETGVKFLIADGREIFEKMSPDLISKVTGKEIRRIMFVETSSAIGLEHYKIRFHNHP